MIIFSEIFHCLVDGFVYIFTSLSRVPCHFLNSLRDYIFLVK